MNIEHKHIVITGASSGIGLQLLDMLSVFNGVKIIAVARHIETIPEKEGMIFPFSADLSLQEGIDSVFDYANTIFGSIDIFIANAGFAYMEKIDQPDWKHIEGIFALNVFSPIYSLEKFTKQNLFSPKYFVCTSSAVAFVPLPYYSLYCSTKSALHQFVDTYRYEKTENMSIMTVYPVATRTAFFSKASQKDQPVLPFLNQTSATVAKAMVNGIIHNKKKVYPSLLFRIFKQLNRVFPFLFKSYSCNEKRRMENKE